MSERKPKRRRRFGRVYSRRWASGRQTWSAQYYCKVGERRITRAFDSKKEARDFLAELEKRIVAEVYAPPPTLAEAERQEAEARRPVPAFVDYAGDLLVRRLKAALAPGTITLYRANLKALAGFYGARGSRPAWRLDQITASSFLDFRAWRRTSRNSPHGSATTVASSTINRDQSFAARVLAEAVVDGLIDANPLVGLRMLREPRKPRRYLSKTEIQRLLLACSASFRPVVVAALFTGARRGEILALRWGDVSFEERKITIYRKKTGSGDALDLHPVLAQELRALRRSRNAPRPDEHVFLNRAGNPLADLRRPWKRALQAAGLAGREGLTFHSLRHSFATHFLTGGGNVRDLQAQLGHSRLETTQRYADLVSERRRAGVLALDFAGPRESARRVGASAS